MIDPLLSKIVRAKGPAGLYEVCMHAREGRSRLRNVETHKCEYS